MNSIQNSISIAIAALKVHRARSVLTILGVVIGIALVIVVMSAGNAIRSFIIGQVESFGSDVIGVEIKVPGTNNPVGVQITTLKLSDMEAVSRVENIKDIYAGSIGQAVVARAGLTKKTMLFGVTADYPLVDDAPIADGRFFTEREDRGIARVVTLGPDLKESLFGEEDAVGQNITIDGLSYRVIGIQASRGAAGFFDRDNMAYLPLRTLQKLVDGSDHISFMSATMDDPERGGETKVIIEDIMRERHRITDPEKDDFRVYTVEEAVDLVGTVLNAMQILLIVLASISLIVGGVGIMNIMYVSVSERTYEIGLRKSIGARNKDVLYQFLTESVILTLLGGLIGIVFGTFLAYLISLVANQQGFAWEFIISPQSIVLGVGFSVLVGVVFGLWPARKAAKLSPIEALRYE